MRITSQEDVRKVLGERKDGKALRMVFKKEGIPNIAYLLGMIHNGIIQVNPMDELVLMAVSESGFWDIDGNRTVVVTPTSTFNAEWFTSRLWYVLESLEVVR